MKCEAEGDRQFPGLAEPRRGAFRVPARVAIGRPPPAGLRAGRAPPPPRGGGVAAGACNRDHALPPRPLGRPRAVGLGEHVPRDERQGAAAADALGVRRRPGAPRAARVPTGLPGHVRAPVRRDASIAARSRSRRPGSRCCLCGYRTTRWRRTGSASAATASRWRTRATPGRASRLAELARDADLFVCEATLLTRRGRRLPARPPLARRGAGGPPRCERAAPARYAPARRAPARERVRARLRRSRARADRRRGRPSRPSRRAPLARHVEERRSRCPRAAVRTGTGEPDAGHAARAEPVGGGRCRPHGGGRAAADDHDCAAAADCRLEPGRGTQESTSHSPDGARVSESRNTIGESGSPASGIT